MRAVVAALGSRVSWRRAAPVTVSSDGPRPQIDAEGAESDGVCALSLTFRLSLSMSPSDRQSGRVFRVVVGGSGGGRSGAGGRALCRLRIICHCVA